MLQAEGYDVNITTHEDEGAASFTTVKEDVEYAISGGRTVVLPRVRGVSKPDADVVVLQRPLRRELVECIPYLQGHGIAVVVELDDDFERIPPRNIAWKQTHPKQSPERNWKWLRMACDMADLVTCSTPALARRYGGYVLPNRVPESYFAIEREPNETERPVIGWTGNASTHPDDLPVAGDAVRRLILQGRADFALVGDGRFVAHCMGLPQEYPLRASGYVPIDIYPEYMSQFDVGIVPLEMNAFNEAKSWLKGLEFAALGVPFVASPTSEYKALADTGAGWLADTRKSWFHSLDRLLATRDDVAPAQREAVRSWTYENHAESWWTAWEIAWAKRKAAARV